MADRQEKISFPTNSRVRKTMVVFFSYIFCISTSINLPPRVWVEPLFNDDANTPACA